MEAIDRELATKRARHRRVHALWARVQFKRIQLEHSINALIVEREALAQGQLMIPGTPTVNQTIDR